MKKKRNKAILTLIIMAGLLVLFSYTAIFGWGKEKSCSGYDIKQGLDLAGGVSITYQVVGSGTPSPEDMSDTIYKLQQRVEQYSTEAQVYQEGTNRIDIEIPGVSDANAVLEELGKPGSLVFYDKSGKEVLSGTDVKTATAGSQQNNMGNAEYVVKLQLTTDGAKKFDVATKAAVPNKDPIYIVFDNKIVSAPAVQAEISDGNCVITGMSSAKEAENLASTIRIGGLSLKLNELQSNVVGAQLGNEAIQTALKAGVIGFCIIVVFMISMYFLPGIAASLALSMYVGLIIILLSAFEVTLTLPGIAGIILSIGMAVDANIITFARIKEELATGKTVKSATAIGYKKAFTAILDGNLCTLIAAAILGMKGTGAIRGFAETLALGIVLSLFTAQIITRIFVNAFNELGLDKVKFYGVKKERKPIDFIGHRYIFFAISIAAILTGFVAMGYYHGTSGKALNYSLDFMGGTQTTVEFNKDYTLQQLDNEIVPKFEKVTGDANVQVQKVNDSKQVIFKTRTLNVSEREKLNDMLKKDYNLKTKAIAAETISSTISNEMQSNAVIAVVLTSLAIMLYIWFRFKDLGVGAAALISLIHDAFVTLMIYAVIRISVGSTFIACMLTLLGYSINDTVVVFDRIRENASKHPKEVDHEELKYIINNSITETLARSIFSSATTVIMVTSLFIFGVESIREFALPLMVGIVSGTYSSICIAAPIWYILKVHFEKKQAAKKGKNSKNGKKDQKKKVTAAEPAKVTAK